jgi:mono/diheme cytochrome c family protein
MLAVELVTGRAPATIVFIAALRLGAVVAFCLAADAAVAEDSGKEIFERHCALCHGLDGSGNGPLANAMKLVPADLTRLAVKNNGEFPANKVADVVRNGGAVLGHGSTAMPAWGNYFAEKGHPKVAKERIAELARYLKSLQQK